MLAASFGQLAEVKRFSRWGAKELVCDPLDFFEMFSVRPMHDLTPDLDPTSWQGVLRGLDYLGTTVFTISGTITAGQVGMDLLGESFWASIPGSVQRI